MEMKLLTANIQEATAFTHGGVFHADDVFSTILLHRLHPDWRFCRVKEPSESLPSNAVLFDIGGGAFDHHQPDFSEIRPSGVKYAAFGLLWRAFGIELLKKRGASDPAAAFAFFDESLVSSVDAHDNGQWEQRDVPSVTVSHLIAAMNPFWNESRDFDEAFLRAFQFAETVFDRELDRCISQSEARKAILTAAAQAEHGVLTLSRYIPWQKEWLNQAGGQERILRVIYPSVRGGYCVCCVERDEDNLFPKAWAGLKGAALASATRVDSAVFCHPGRFLCIAGTQMDAQKLAFLNNNSVSKSQTFGDPICFSC